MNQPQLSHLVAPCGLYCGACRRYRKGSCPGCAENHHATWCKIRTCQKRPSDSTCGQCQEHAHAMDCRLFNNIFSKLFALIFRSDRQASLDLIKTLGRENYALQMDERREMVVKRR